MLKNSTIEMLRQLQESYIVKIIRFGMFFCKGVGIFDEKGPDCVMPDQPLSG